VHINREDLVCSEVRNQVHDLTRAESFVIICSYGGKVFDESSGSSRNSPLYLFWKHEDA
jgi:hypothetical protein